MLEVVVVFRTDSDDNFSQNITRETQSPTRAPAPSPQPEFATFAPATICCYFVHVNKLAEAIEG